MRIAITLEASKLETCFERKGRWLPVQYPGQEGRPLAATDSCLVMVWESPRAVAHYRDMDANLNHRHMLFASGNWLMRARAVARNE